MKKGISVILAVLLAVSCLTGLSGCGSSKKTTLYVYNWGQYISEGDDGSLDVIAAFEEAYPNIRVQYSTYDSNEIMYSKLSNGGITVDVIIPSDYMIGRMVQEGMLEELNFDNIPNYQYIDDSFKNTSYDPENKYSVPYTWGTVGIIYNTKYDVNTTDETELQACAAKLAEQKPVVQQYVMDQIFDAMENEEAWIAPYYAGDYLTMVEENPDLAFYRPTTQGYNMFIDAMCIPTCCQEKEAAEAFINFLCSPEISSANMEFLGYSVPSTAAKELMDPEVAGSEVAYPDADTLTTGTSFNFLPEETSRYMESLFMEVRNG